MHRRTTEPPAFAVTEAQWRDLFERAPMLTVGLEEEALLVEPDGGALLPRADDACRALRGDARFRRELPAAQLEIATPPAATVPEAAAALADGRRRLLEVTAGWARPLVAGVHPCASAEGQMSGGVRYTAIVDEYRWAAVRSLTCGLHVHVAVPGADRALAVFNALRSYLPEMTALAANAPYHEGRDTGLATVRPKLCEAFPRQGIPPALDSWADLERLLTWGRSAIADAGELWWELRPHGSFGTLEIRVADAQTSSRAAAAVAAFVHALVAWLVERHDAGERLPVAPGVRLEINRWRALRHGLHGELLDLDSGRPEPVRWRLRHLLEALAPVAERIGCAAELADVHALLAANGADRQREVAARDGLPALVDWLAAQYDPVADRVALVA